MDLAGVRDLAAAVRGQVERVVVGNGEAVDLLLTALLAEGHVLLEGVPGTAKTLLARAFAASLSLPCGRIQFTPDLMPGDVLGTNLFDFASNRFHLRRGPIFTEVLIADEINRAPPKTQAALLEAMQERAVTLDGTTHELGAGFMVVATQNPIEQEGTYPLPEAQLDRFLFRVPIGYPSRDDERAMVALHGHRTAMPRPEEFDVKPVADLPALLAAREVVRSVRLADPVLDYVVDLARATRGRPTLLCGVSPRGANVLAVASRALAALRGRDFAIPDDVKALAVPLFGHRVVLSPGAEIEGVTAQSVVREVLEQVPAPR
jgi:MoxR-like ATPase